MVGDCPTATLEDVTEHAGLDGAVVAISAQFCQLESFFNSVVDVFNTVCLLVIVTRYPEEQ